VGCDRRSGIFGLLGPLLGILGVYENFDCPWAPILVTVLIAAVWVGVVVVQRVPNPLVTLVAVGGMYGVFVILFQIIGAFLGKIPEGEIPAAPGARPSSGTATSCRSRPWCTCTAARPRPSTTATPPT
jgi:hypothetical protein